MKWLIEQTAFDQRIRLEASHVDLKSSNWWDSAYEAMEGNVLSTAGNVAQININGVLTDSPDVMAFLYMGGNTTYSQIKNALGEAMANPEVTEIQLNINSPGGSVLGLFDLMEYMGSIDKKMVASVRGMAASAAYGIASQADSIEATNAGAFFGSVGVLTTYKKDDDVVTITSTNAPNKVPDFETLDGLEAIRKELDAIHAQFVGMIAKGRGVTVDFVNTNFGRGSVLMSLEAESKMMIDCVRCSGTKIEVSNVSKELGAEELTLEQLKADHPELFAQAVQTGIDKERSRACAHLTLGEASGAHDVASKAIAEGKSVSDDATQAAYLSAKINSQTLDLRSKDDDDKGAEGTPAGGTEGLSELESQIIAKLGGLKRA